MKIQTLATLAATALALSACSTGEPAHEHKPASQEAASTQQATPEPTLEAPAAPVYETVTQYGSKITATFPAGLDHELVAQTDEFMKQAGIQDVQYALIEIDNRAGELEVMMPEMSVFNSEGMEWVMYRADNVISELVPYDMGDGTYIDFLGQPVDKATYQGLRQAGENLTEKLPRDVQPAGVGEMVMVLQADEAPAEVTRVASYPHGIAGVEDLHPVN